MDIFISLAKKTVETYVKTGKIIYFPTPLPKYFQKKAGVFVSIRKVTPAVQFTSSTIKERFKDNLHPQEIYDGYQPSANHEELRGCIGTYLPVRENIALEIIHNVIDSATRDPRFPSITLSELPQLRYSVDILSCPEEVNEITDLDPKKYGLIVKTKDGRKGLLLPNLNGVKTVTQQIEICKLKAGIFSNEEVTLQRFTVERHAEK